MTTADDQLTVKGFRGRWALHFPTPDRFISACFTAGEAQELVDALIRLEHPTFVRGRKMDPQQAVLDELGDVYFMLISTANHFDANLSECLKRTLDKIEKRVQGTP